MAGKKEKNQGKPDDPTFRNVCENRRARHDYNVISQLECGFVLVGSEVKSLRGGFCNLSEAYARIKNNELWLINCDIPEYDKAHQFNHNPRRMRKLLVHRKEIRKLEGATRSPGQTLIPLKVYFTKGLAKVLIGVCQGKQEHDKRDALRTAQAQRDLKIAMTNRVKRNYK